MPEHSKINVAVQTRVALLKNRTIRCLYKTTLQAESRLSAVVIAWAQDRVEKFCQALMAGIKAADQGEGAQQQQHREGGEGLNELNEQLNEERNEERSGQRSEEKRGEESAELEQPQHHPTEEPQEPTNEGKQTTGYDVQMNLVSLSRRDVLLCFDLFLKDCDAAMRSRVDQSLEEPIHFVFRKHGTYYVQPKQHLDSEVSRKYLYARSKDKGARPLYSDLDNPPLYDNGRRVPDEERATYGMSTFFETTGRPRHYANV
ncbi:hypothetical protein SPBR_05265 [Sporothrix brasiliensis 5110]|uniref:Uncharacterized protein n=1 Tax=Sporothrix brasiliensis 5110 TaxID=1398154 RepID=A0A0C2IL20_9PEZI|nr:uncharacterized protein SPBR_05265 [Sporothrix brasiliensis 5110]KIH87660.1 hypothetical protein SPBR_05265 [Sporothrix brasiliensis 5110]